jgi:uncharacterized repeat protein (TIGR01451 family)
MGNELYAVPLPAPLGGDDWNGAMAAPTLDNIDADADLEVVINTAHAGLVAYDLPGTANARIQWQTGRGSYQRVGSLVKGSLQNSMAWASTVTPDPGETFGYIITLKNSGPLLAAARMTDTLPTALSFAGSLTASSGTTNENSGIVTWNGSVEAGVPVTINFEVTADPGLSDPTVVINTVRFDDGEGVIITRQLPLIVGGRSVYLPLIR